MVNSDNKSPYIAAKRNAGDRGRLYKWFRVLCVFLVVRVLDAMPVSIKNLFVLFYSRGFPKKARL